MSFRLRSSFRAIGRAHVVVAPWHPRVAAIVLACLAPVLAPAQDRARAACTPRAAPGDVASDQADARGAAVTSARPVGLANWDVRPWQRHRLWITVTAANRGDAPTSVLPEIVVDLRRDGSSAHSLVGDPLVLAPHAGAATRMTMYVPDDSKTLGLRLHGPVGAPAGIDVAATFAAECSESRFDLGEMPKSAAALLDEALALYANDVADPLPNGRQAFDDVRLMATGAQDSGDVAWAMRGMMTAIGDDHSTMLPPGPQPAPAAPAAPRAPSVDRRPDGTAVLQLFAVDLHSDAERLAWARDLHERIAAVAATRPRAWIVDLREHQGRDMWAPLAALSGLLDGPSVGAFVTRQGREEWIVDRGAARIAGGAAMVDLELPPEPPFTGPIAVLLSEHTTNVGELVAVAFEGRARTRFFGAPTKGFPDSGVHAHALSDGSTLRVLDTRDADRNGVVYRESVTPDEPLDASVHTDAIPQAAVDWVRDQHAGSGAGR